MYNGTDEHHAIFLVAGFTVTSGVRASDRMEYGPETATTLRK